MAKKPKQQSAASAATASVKQSNKLDRLVDDIATVIRETHRRIITGDEYLTMALTAAVRELPTGNQEAAMVGTLIVLLPIYDPQGEIEDGDLNYKTLQAAASEWQWSGSDLSRGAIDQLEEILTLLEDIAPADHPWANRLKTVLQIP